MNIFEVAEELDTRLATLPGLVAHYVGPRKSVSVPCSVIAWPSPIDYLGTYGRMMKRITDWPVMLLGGSVDDGVAFQRTLEWASDTGPSSVATLLDSSTNPYTSCDTVTVKSCDFDVITWQGQDLQGALFTIDVVGSGA